MKFIRLAMLTWLPHAPESITIATYADVLQAYFCCLILQTLDSMILEAGVMPTYVYACDTCQVQFEKFQSFHDEPLRECPSCQSAVRRVLQPAGIVFKGSGWHITDYKGSSNAVTSSSSTTSDTSGSSASESTPASPAPAPASSAPPPASSSDA